MAFEIRKNISNTRFGAFSAELNCLPFVLTPSDMLVNACNTMA